MDLGLFHLPHEPVDLPPGFGVRQSSGAFKQGPRQPHAFTRQRNVLADQKRQPPTHLRGALAASTIGRARRSATREGGRTAALQDAGARSIAPVRDETPWWLSM